MTIEGFCHRAIALLNERIHSQIALMGRECRVRTQRSDSASIEAQ